VGTWEHRAILEGNKGTRTPLGDPHQLKKQTNKQITPLETLIATMERAIENI